MIFSLFVAQMVVGYPDVHTILVTIWCHITITVLGVLMYFGRRHQSHHKLSRTVVQIYVLCALGFSWIFFVLGVVSLNSSGDICGWNRRSCGLFTAAHFLSWVLVVVLFSAAYATYRAFHGSTIVPVASSVAAWRISGVAEGPGGYIKI